MGTFERKSQTKETSRVEAFSDGVFAIAVTLLVLDIHVPVVHEGKTLLQMILADWVTYLAFVIGFFTILTCWINHHYMFEYIERCNGTLLLLNGVKLLIVSFTPFVTSVLSRYVATGEQQTAVSIYALNFAFMGTSMFGIWFYAERSGLVGEMSASRRRASTRLYMLAGVISTSIFVLSFISIGVALIVSAIMFAGFILPKKAVDILSRPAPELASAPAEA